mgnify:CR=1 FL=1
MIYKIQVSTWFNLVYFCSALAIFAFDIRTFLGVFLPINVITSLILLIYTYTFYELFFGKNRPLPIKLRGEDILMLIFFFLYGGRMYYNIFIEQVDQLLFVNRFTCIIYYVFICIIPYMICRRISWLNYDFKKFLWYLYFLFLLGLLISFKSILSLIASGDSFFQGRAEANTYLDTIGYGHTSLTFILICFCILFINKVKLGIRIVLILSIFFGFISMGLANSRSPFVALFVILLAYSLVHINIKHILLIIVVFSVIIGNLESIDFFFKEYFESTFVERIQSIFELGSIMEASSGRDALYIDGIKLFEENPLWGKSIVLTEGEFKGSYVHNVFLEVFMGTGVIGGLLFSFIVLWALIISFKMLKNNSLFLFFGLVFIQNLILLQFSRTLMFLPVFWASLGCLFSIKNYRHEKNSNSNS